MKAVLRIGSGPVSLEQLVAVARGEARVEIERGAKFQERLEAGRRALEGAVTSGRPVYGVTTGVGASVTTDVPAEERQEMALNIMRFHGCGTGRRLDPEAAAAVVVARLISLEKPVVRARYGYADAGEPGLGTFIDDFLESHLREA